MKQSALFLTLFAAVIAFPGAVMATPENIVYSVNTTDSPVPPPGGWTFAGDVGWLYTPTSNLTITDVGSSFGTAISPPATVVIFDYTGNASAPVSGSPIDSGQLSGPADTLDFATLNAPVVLTGGDTYLIGFEGVSTLGFNITMSPTATSQGDLFYDTGDGSFSLSTSFSPYTQPILALADNASPGPATPEPSTWMLLFISLAAIASFKRLRPVPQSQE
jgi:hypothetical protein